MLQKIRSLVFSPISLLTLFSLILAATLWYLGPLLAFGGIRPFDSTGSRLIAIGAVAALTVIAILGILLARRSRDRKMTEAITTSAAAPARGSDEEAVEAELGELRQRFTEALAFLRKSKLGGRFRTRYLYQLPWYIIIGPPGAGKTTAIVNSGLQFPLAERMGKTAIGGVGGTRNCDWWFTNEAVLIDTAGRYTTQDSNKDADAKAWSGFLDMLKKYRRRQPVNGAMVAISLSDLSLLDEEGRRAHARAIRVRLHELRERLGVRFPVYILLTKADLIAGFQEFFDNLGTTEREQVWGFTLPFEKASKEGDPVAAFDAEFQTLVNQLSSLSLERMQAETDYQRRSLIAGFPSQIASLHGVAKAFLTDIFQESRYEDSQLLRGVYFTSGTQEGTPIDRLMMGMSRTFGIGRQAIGTGRGQGRSYFLTRLLNGVIFQESGLVSADDVVERRYRWIKRGALAAGVVGLAGAAAVWTNSYLGNLDLVAGARAQVEQFREISKEIPGNPIADDDLPPIVPALNTLRDLPGNPAASDPEPPVELTFGLYQGDAIGTESAQAYRGALNSLFLPRMLFRLEEQMQANINNTDFLFEALKVYLMLGLQGTMDEATVKQWMLADWALEYPGQDALQADLADHLDELLNQPMRRIGLNGPLVDQIQSLLAETPLAERIYQGIVKSPATQRLTPFRITDAGGPAVSRVFIRTSGKPLSAGVEGVYTYEGFHAYFLPELATIEDRVKFQKLVLGPKAEEVTPETLSRLSRDVLALYENDYVSRYDELLADVDIIPMESLGQATQVVNVLSGPTSPVRNILNAVDKETRLTQLPGTEAVKSGAASAAASFVRDEVVSALDAQGQSAVAALSSAIPASDSGAQPAIPGAFVEERFATLHDVIAGGGVPSRLDEVMQRMSAVFDELNRLSLGQDSGASIVGQKATASDQLEVLTTQLPNPLQRWTAQVVAASSGAAVGGARTDLNIKWQADVLPFCQQAINGRYPVDRQAKADIAIKDFGKLFAPDGLIDGFFKENLAPFVDTSANPWRLRRVNGVDIGISSAVISQFQKAREIRDSFFLAPGLPSVTFDIKPVALDPNVEQVVVEIDGQPVTYAHGPPEVTPLVWPGQGGGGRTRVTVSPARSDLNNTIQREGPWAWFRLLDTAEVRRTNVSDRNRVIFNLGGRIAIFQLRAGSALNPFTITALNNFSCPSSL
ncbi:type VI secretion system membrane subunit TssM [Roseibium litorale]|uniref:Type VI secretion system membrane subunit TssM n=1 Tax=Roseibium litorale TaxID=2803841 RepID=A0ABR9CLV1_9HYPH|nr:type VI secretion system membrane subunit TssM [Roseibium litorale]MBD8891282.1 type VI secretion system membrane subunit TssM [Roseibium litorale]